MPQLIEIPDSVVPGTTGRIHVDHRKPKDADNEQPLPPLVLLGGMTQTLYSWGGQIRPISSSREVLVYEARGQGKTELSYDDVSMPRQVEDFENLLDAMNISQPVDLCGFSFGGRLSLAIAAAVPHRIRKLVVSGVGTHRGAVGQVIIRGWRESLATGDLQALAWVSLADVVSPQFLEKNSKHFDDMVRATVTRNNYAGIKALFETTFDQCATDYLPETLAKQVQCPTLLIGGELDRLAPPDQVQELAEHLTDGSSVIFDAAGHTVAIEAAVKWRQHVLAFLND